MDNEELLCYIGKKNFVDKLSTAVAGAGGVGHIVEVRYELYEHQEYGYQEYLVLEFRGGAISVRSVNINSHSAILQDLGKICNGGYYEEVEDYKEIRSDSSWKQIL